MSKGKFTVDYEVQQYFYDKVGTPTDAVEALEQLSGEHSLAELREFYAPLGYNSARVELDYRPPWISEELLEYSLKGLDSIKI